MNIPLLNLKRQYTYLKDDIEKVISNILESGAYINGPALILEQPFALVAQVAEVDDAPVAQPQLMRAGDVFAQLLRRDAHHRAHQRHFQLRVCPPE